MTTIQTRWMLAGAYKGGRQDLKHLLTHSVEVDANECEAELTLCGRIKGERLADVMADEAGNDKPPTCKTCLRRDPRFREAK